MQLTSSSYSRIMYTHVPDQMLSGVRLIAAQFTFKLPYPKMFSFKMHFNCFSFVFFMAKTTSYFNAFYKINLISYFDLRFYWSFLVILRWIGFFTWFTLYINLSRLNYNKKNFWTLYLKIFLRLTEIIFTWSESRE